MLRSLKLSDEDVLRLVRTFLDSVPERMESLRQAISRGDLVQIHTIAHSLKGTLAIFSSTAADFARSLEEVGTARPIEQSASLLANLDDALRDLTESMTTFAQSAT
jgi:HPt (histidine-containing phosphotransfer) domain-containing protein